MGVRPRIAATDAVSTVTRSIRFELVVLILAMGLSVTLTTALTPSYELLEPAVAASTEIVQGIALTEFATLLKLGAISIALTGALALGYELGKFGGSRETHSDQPPHHAGDEAQVRRD